MREWKKLKDYYEQQEKYKEISGRFEAKITEARNKITESNAKRELILRREATSGVDASEEKAKARKELVDAEEMLAVAREEAQKVRQYIFEENANNPERISLLDLIRDWQQNFMPSICEKELAPIQQAVAEAREAYLNAVLDYLELKNEIQSKHADIHDKMRHVRNENGHTCFTPGTGWDANRDLKQIKDTDLSDINHGRLPQNVKRMKRKDKKGGE